MRLIDADKIQYSKDWVVTDRIPKVGGYNAKAIYRVTKEEIDAMPTVDAVPERHGHWVKWFETIVDFIGVANIPHCKCSECGREYDPHDASHMNYCPNCGVKLDVKDGDSNG